MIHKIQLTEADRINYMFEHEEVQGILAATD